MTDDHLDPNPPVNLASVDQLFDALASRFEYVLMVFQTTGASQIGTRHKDDTIVVSGLIAFAKLAWDDRLNDIVHSDGVEPEWEG